MEDEIKRLQDYYPEKEKFRTQKENTLHNAGGFYKGRKMILIAFESNAFPLPKQYSSENVDDWKEDDEMDSTHIIPDETDELLASVEHRKTKTEEEKVFEKVVKKEYHTIDELDELLFKIKGCLDSDLIIKHFNYNTLREMLESLDNTKSTYKNGIKVSLIRSGLRDLKNEIKQMSKNEIKSERPDVIVNLVEKILDFNEQPDTFYTLEELPRNIVPELESEESAAERRNQRGQGLKILTSEQMIWRLPISLAQLKAENNSQKLKNEIRQLLYSLCRSRKLSKSIYKHLINTII